MLGNLPKFIAFAGLSFMVAVYRSSNDQTEYYVRDGGVHHAVAQILQTLAALRATASPHVANALVDDVIRHLDALQIYAASNDAVKRLLCRPDADSGRLLCHAILDLALAPLDDCPPLAKRRQWAMIRREAALVIERCCLIGDGANSNLSLDIALALVARDDLRADVRRMLTTALANAALHASSEQATALVAAGALRAFAIAESDPKVKLHLFGRGGERLVRLAARDAAPPSDTALVADFGARRVLPSTPLLTPLYDVLDQGMNSLFIYTGIGGVLWGAGVALYHHQPRAAVLSNALRTGAVSTCIPLYFVGLLLNFYVHSRKRIDDTAQLIALDTVLLASLYPAFPLVRVVDRAFPFWVGGHVVGFAGYFTSLVYRDDDMLRHGDERARQAPRKPTTTTN